MQTLFRLLNLVLGPVMTLVFAARLAGLQIAGKDAGEALGGALAGLVMLCVELLLSRGPRYSQWLRRWLEPSAAFEGIWMQRVIKGHVGNEIAVFSVDCGTASGDWSVHGRAYSKNGVLSAKWRSTEMVVDGKARTAAYMWTGERLPADAPTADKGGVAHLSLRPPPAFSLPVAGDGNVTHIGEATRIDFLLERVTDRLLAELGLDFSVRQLQLNAHREELRLVAKFLERNVESTPTATEPIVLQESR